MSMLPRPGTTGSCPLARANGLIYVEMPYSVLRYQQYSIGRTQLLHPASQSGVFACPSTSLRTNGSMVRSDYLFVVFCARRAQKTTNEEIANTALPKAQTANCVSPIQFF